MINKITKNDIITEYNNISSCYEIYDLDRNNFRQFINGLYQAEGTTGVYFTKEDKLITSFNFSIGQNYSIEALKVFLSLQKILKVGLIKLEFNAKGIPHIRYVVSNTKDIMLKVLPYFSLIYGKKRIDQYRIEKIYKLQVKLSKEVRPNIREINELIRLVYSTNFEGQKRKLTLENKLAMFHCSSLSYINEDIEENNNLPSKLFIIGLFLGDGSFGFVFNASSSRSPVFAIKIVFNFAAQSNTESNIELLELVAKSLNLNPNIYRRKSGMIGLEYAGRTVFDIIIPFLLEHKDWLYWRNNQLANTLKIVEIIKNKGHLTKNGMKEIVNLLYCLPNKYQRPKEFWIDLIDKRYSR